MAFCRRQARVSALLQTPPESLAGSPGMFESPSEEIVGQTAPRLPFFRRLSFCVVRGKVDNSQVIRALTSLIKIRNGLIQDVLYHMMESRILVGYFCQQLINVFIHGSHITCTNNLLLVYTNYHFSLI